MAQTKRWARIVVTTTTEYLVPLLYDEPQAVEHTMLNGEPLSQLIEDWFVRYDINVHHASRDSHHLGGSSRVTDVRYQLESE